MFLAAPEPAERALLQHAQQLHLRDRHHLGDLVKKSVPRCASSKHAGAPVVRAGERAFLVPEDLALEQRLGNRRAVDRDERE